MKGIISLVAVLAVAVITALALGASAATSASALPEFKGLTGVTDIHFTGQGGLTVFRAKRAGVEGSLECQEVLVSGLILVPSMLVDKISITLHTGCELMLGGTKTRCNEPYLAKVMMGQLGFTKSLAGPVGILAKPESGTEFLTFTCGGNVTTIAGEFVIEIPEINARTGASQYNKFLNSYELIVKAKNADKQESPETFELLPSDSTLMSGIKLSVTGFFGEGGTLSGSSTITLGSDGEIET